MYLSHSPEAPDGGDVDVPRHKRDARAPLSREALQKVDQPTALLLVRGRRPLVHDVVAEVLGVQVGLRS